MDNERKKLKAEARPFVWLKFEFDRLKEKNPKYSLRAFAKALDIPSGRLSEYLSNKRQITVAVGQQIASKLKFDGEMTAVFLKCVSAQIESQKGLKRELSQIEKAAKFDFIPTDSQDRFRVVADWHHFAILSVMELNDFQSSANWIARKLGLPQTLIAESLDRLERLKIIDRSKDNWKVQSANLRTTDGVDSAALKEFYATNLALAAKKLKTVAVEDRDYSAITIAIDKAKLPFAKGMIRDFRRKLARILEAGDSKDEIYQLSIQFFPLNESDPSSKPE